MLQDLFPLVSSPPKNVFLDLEKAIGEAVEAATLIAYPTWLAKIVQLHETCLVRHGIMVVGPAAGGKSRIIEILQTALTKTTGTQHKIVRLNPKSVTSQELFGQTDPQSGEWETGVFASVWQKFNNRSLPCEWGGREKCSGGARGAPLCRSRHYRQHVDHVRRPRRHALDRVAQHGARRQPPA